MKLNGWQRGGVVASIVWAIVWLPLWAIVFDKSLFRIKSSDISDILLITLGSIALGWGIVYGGIFSVRWIKQGFDDKPVQ